MHLPSVSIYLVFSAVSALVPILALPVLTRLLTPQDYGLFTIFSIVAMFVGNLFRLELHVALKREYAEHARQPARFAPFLGTAFAFSTLLLAPWLLAVGVMALFTDRFYGMPVAWLALIVVLAYLRSQTINLHHLWQIGNHALPFGLWGLATTLGNFGIAIGLLLAWRADWQARAWAEWGVALAGFGLALGVLRRQYGLRWHFDVALLRRMLSLSLPLMPSGLMSYVFMVSDRVAIAEFSGPHELGLYSVALQLSGSIGLVFSAVLPAWESWIFNKLGAVDRRTSRLLAKRMGIMALGSALLVVVMPPALGLILPLLTDRSFAGSGAYLLPCLAAAAGAGLFGLAGPILVFMRRTRAVALINVGMLAFNLPMLGWLARQFGPAGAAWALTLTYVLGTLAVLAAMMKYRDR